MRVLVVEDDAALRAQLVASLSQENYVCDQAEDGRMAWSMGSIEPYDAIVLDLGLPYIDGLTVLKRWRSEGIKTPVLILTARDLWHEKVAGIDAGADDYMSKPFHVEELLARLRALIRRSQGLAHPILECGPLTLDTRVQAVSCDGALLTLTSHEFKLLAYLMHRPNQVISRIELIEHLYAQDYERDSNTVEVFIARLRKKLPEGLIETLRGQGYRLRSGTGEP